MHVQIHAVILQRKVRKLQTPIGAVVSSVGEVGGRGAALGEGRGALPQHRNALLLKLGGEYTHTRFIIMLCC